MIIVTFLLLLITHTVTCKPATHKSNKFKSIGFQKAFDIEKRYEACEINLDLNELCERCMRITEASGDDVFGMCCSNEDNAQEFCRNYVYFGIK
jgi:hypothetical protein